ncbi:LSU ribosomal protein L10p (P0) [Mycoplasmopsis meleagridis]|uniref:Large ribosomal subunit protein uL10 n=1 Tax=Mycoplasmopsis meleagridis ATCC 25294 TaxID=1264554 RepID=A0A0F5H1N6_9BACT|nr:50S ribosomal protein L10 [Mycoplasmopsis meleagridis]KKB27040.1 LSU ribosomal protein L10p (P0) [Mycoplasmopsis meleagridis ATCC 25294]OAD18433.1 LSU ribosomal protein L10p (P0) [Mycoplasmopsis meleagridis]VEU77345.1 50s ribosomal protein L10 [Mycoplasmopsis meleagridis]
MHQPKESAFRLIKKETVQEINDKLKASKSLVVAEYRGLSVEDLTKLRILAKKINVEVKVFKNRLFKLAAKNNNFAELNEHLVGPNIFFFSKDDELSAFKLVSSFAKENKLLIAKAGIFENKVVNANGVIEIASLPNYEEALTILARSLMNPLQQLSLSLKLLSEKKE